MSVMPPIIDIHFGRLLERYPSASVKRLNNSTALVTVRDLPVPDAWSVSAVTVHFLVPNGYPAANPDCFWVEPALKLPGGTLPKNSAENNQVPEAGFSAHWFSWHIESQAWSPNHHDLLTWLRVCMDRLEKIE